MATSVKTGWILLLTLLLSLLILAFASPQRSCFQSQFVRQVKWHMTQGEREDIFNCRVEHESKPISPKIFQKISKFEKRLASTEFFLNRMDPALGRFVITVSEERPDLFQVQGSSIFLGVHHFDNPRAVDLALIRSWLESVMNLGSTQLNYRQALAEIIFGLKDGQVNLGQTKMWRPRAWHETLMTLRSYCHSGVRYYDHDEFCQALDKVGLSSEVTESLKELNDLSMAAYLKDVWLASFLQLNLQDRQRVLSSLPIWLKSLQGIDVDGSQMTLDSKLQKMVRQFLIKPLEDRKELQTLPHRNLLSRLLFELQAGGFQQDLTMPRLDVLYKTSGSLEPGSPLFARLVSRFSSSPRSYLAVIDDEGYWLPPYEESLPRGVFDRVTAELLVLKRCEPITGSALLEYAKIAEKILILRECDVNAMPDLSPLALESVQSFARKNLRFSFILFNSAWILTHTQELIDEEDIFTTISERKADQPLFQLLRWQSLAWEPIDQVYLPETSENLVLMFR